MTSENKRKHDRIQSLNMSYICLDENKQFIKQAMGRTLNISESGILLETHFPIESNHTVKLSIGLEEDLLDIDGKPVHIRTNKEGKYEVGIEFVDLDKHSSKLLKQFIKGSGIRKTSTLQENE